MFVHKFEGGWLDHPFWKAKFLIENPAKLAAIRESRVRTVVIDTARSRTPIGRRPAEPAAPRSGTPNAAPGRASAASRINTIKKRTAAQAVPPGPVSMAQELDAAQNIARQAHERLGKTFIAARLGRALDVRKVEPVVTDILASVRRNPQAFAGLMRCKLKNEQVFRHALSVSALMVALADKMKLPIAEIRNCGLAGLLLDIGVNHLPHNGEPAGGDYRNLDERIWRQHVVLGHRALENDGALPPLVLDACRYHHERMDGSGFPEGCKGEDIPQIARMAAICDSFDFHLIGSAQAQALDPAAAIAAMQAETGAYDPEILRLFIETVGLYPVGAFVALASGKLAMVIDEDPKDPLRPVVQVFYSHETGERTVPHRIALAKARDNDWITGIADLAGLDLPDPAQLRDLMFFSACQKKAGA